MDFETLLRESDFITVHSPLTEDTHNMISTEQFKIMKKMQFLSIRREAEL